MFATLRICGGLGNQLFQLLALAHITHKYHLQPIIFDATKKYSVDRQLDALSIVNAICNKKVQHVCSSHVFNIFHHIRIGRLPLPFCINDQNFSDHAQRVGFRRGLYRMPLFFMDGYFQEGLDDRLFCQSLPLLGFESSLTFASNDNIVAIHVRGGDFLRDHYFNVCNVSYYLKAIDYFSDLGLTTYRIISDDSFFATKLLLQFCDNFPACSFEVSHGMTAVEDFHSLCAAKFKIIGNSTFAFWAAALSQHRSACVSPGVLSRNIMRTFSLNNEKFIAV
jgi:hypothetical protein